MNTLVWCVECEKMVEMEVVRLKNVEFCGHVVEFNVLTDGGEVAGAELDFCEFPLGFTFVAPPDVQGEEDFLVSENAEEVSIPDLVEA